MTDERPDTPPAEPERKPPMSITFPELDEWGTPKTKLPDCPRCGEDELGVIHPQLMLCYACGWKLERRMCERCKKVYALKDEPWCYLCKHDPQREGQPRERRTR